MLKLYKTPEIEVPTDNPFKNCKLEREQNAIFLTQLLNNIDAPFVLAIDSGWGTGKTTFLRMFRQYLNNNGFSNIIHFNAWESDYSEDPLLSFIGEINTAVSGLSDGKKEQALVSMNGLIEAGGFLLKKSIPLAVSMATSGLIKDIPIESLKEKLPEFFQNIMKTSVDNYEEEKNKVNDFKKNLEELVSRISEDSKPFIFIIDELDRCKPTYAIALLERLKHFFNVPGIIFILALDKDQLTHSVRTVYGANMDADGYIRRFIDLEYSLSTPESYNKIISYLYEAHGFDQILAERKDYGETDKDFLDETLEFLCVGYILPARILEKIFLRIGLIFASTDKDENLFTPLLVLLIVLKYHRNDLYKYIGDSRNDVGNVLTEINKRREIIIDAANSSIGANLHALTALCHKDQKQISEIFVRYRDNNPRNIYEEALFWISKGVVKTQFLNKHKSIFSYLDKKIDLIEQFKV